MILKFYDSMKILCAVLIFAFSAGVVQAQDRINGTVYDADGTTPLAGASVVVKNRGIGAVTDSNGNYTVTASADDVLVIGFLGYNGYETEVRDRKKVDVTLVASSVEMEGLVVTALGLTRQQRSLGYATTTVSGDDLTQTGSGNWVDALSGRVAGLKLDQAGTGPMGSIRATIRGDNSLNYGNNEVLVVIDGVPVSSSGVETASGSNYSNSDAPVDFGNGLSDLNADDIESVTVLKGAAATALYGSRAGNGAFIITTKTAKKSKGLGVTVSSTTSFDRVMRWPDFQKEYGGGNDNGEKEYSFWTVSADKTTDGQKYSRNQGRYGFGEKYDAGKLRMQYDSRDWETDVYTPLPWVYQDNWYKGFFQTGATTKNIITVSGNDGEGSSMRLSVTDMRSRWVIPNTPSRSQTFSLNAAHKVNHIITLRAVVNYLRRDSDNVPYSGYGSKNPLYSLIWATSNHDINRGFKAEYFAGRFDDPDVRAANALFYNAENSYNPYFTVYEEVNTVDRDRVYGNFSMTIDFAPKLRLLLRSGLDMNNEFRTQRAPKYSGSTPGGFYREQTLRSYELNNEFLLTYNHSFGDDQLSLNAGLGGVNWRRETANTRLNVPQLNEDYIFNLSNVHEDYTLEASGKRTAKEKNSFLGYLNLAWKNYLYLDLTGRNDWSSTLDPEYWSYFYPSVGLSFVVSDALQLQQSTPWIDLIKLRASWAQVGNDTDAYAIYESAVSTDYSGGFRVPTTLATRDLSPERINSTEVGVDISLFRKRILLDASYYHTITDKQIIAIPVDALTGAVSMRRNAGEMLNHGVELAATVVPVQRPDRGFRWSFSMNWSKNWNKLKSMYEGWDNNSPLQTAMGTTIGSRVYVYSYVGQPMHYIYGKDYVRAPVGATYVDAGGNTVDCSGMKIINAATGMPALTETVDNRIAKVNPDWYAGMTHHFSYKGWSMGLHFAGQYGGHTFSANHFALAYQGKLKNSLPGRYDGLVVDGVNAVADASGTITYQANHTVTENIQSYYNAYVYIRDNVRENTFSTSYLKLKNVHLDYSFPAHLLQKTGFLQGATIGVYATNVFCLTRYPMFDPETGNLHGTNIHRGVETGALPMTRSFGININLSF